MEYALLDVGRERLIARYVGPADAIAFNRATLRASLASLEGGPLITAAFDGKQQVSWVQAAGMLPPHSLPIPTGWVAEVGAAQQCEGLAAADSALTTSPLNDFTVTFRAALIAGTGMDATTAAARCSPRRASFGGSSYEAAANWLGTAYTVEGAFVQSDRGLFHLQYVSPTDRTIAARDLFVKWLQELTR